MTMADADGSSGTIQEDDQVASRVSIRLLELWFRRVDCFIFPFIPIQRDLFETNYISQEPFIIAGQGF